MTVEPRSALWPMLLAPRDHDREDLRLTSASGVRVHLADGRELIDGASGLWNVNLGYGNAAVGDAVARAMREASYLTTFRYTNTWAEEAAAALCERAGPPFARAMFSTSGGAAVDLVMKLARHVAALRGDGRRNLVVGLDGSYHGLTYGSFALTGEDLGQRMYGVDPRLVRHIRPNSLEDLERLLDRDGGRVAAVVVEPVLGSGAVALDDEFVAALVARRERDGFLLVADEVATGFARTGPFFASARWPAPPDVLITSKGLTNGAAAAAAVLVSAEVSALFTRAGAVLSHGETQAGTPPSCAAILATVAEMERLDVVRSADRVARRLDDGLGRLRETHQVVAGLSGRGCFRGVALADEPGTPLPQHQVPEVVAAVRASGAIVHPGVHGIQVVPVLTSTDSEVDELVDCVGRGLSAYSERAAPVLAATS